MWYKIDNDHIEISVLVKPNAKQTAFSAVTDDYLQLRLHAKPKDGEANDELLKFFAKTFKVPLTQVILKRGEASRNKILCLPLNDHTQQIIVDVGKLIKT